MTTTRFLEGPAGTGKTTAAIKHIRSLISHGAQAHEVLVLVPQRTLGRPYRVAFAQSDWPNGGMVNVATLGGLARRGLEIFWPLVARTAGFGYPEREPVFLTVETAQYFMARFVRDAVRTGVFDSISMTPFDIMRQTLDNLSKAALNDFPISSVADRLIAAWGDRHSSRPPVYRASQELAIAFRQYCLQHNLLDFSLQLEVFLHVLLHEPLYAQYAQANFQHLVVENLEENVPVAQDFIDWLWPWLQSALLIYDTDGGFRLFLGADPAALYAMRDQCARIDQRTEPVGLSASMVALSEELDRLLSPQRSELRDRTQPLGDALTISVHRFFPQMIEWVVAQIVGLAQSGVPLREIVVMAPYLGDSLRFALASRLEEAGVATVSHRPSRAVRDEPAARAVLTLMALAHPEWNMPPPVPDVADLLQQVIPELDPIRAWLLAQIVYRPGHAELGSFDVIHPQTQARITFVAGNKYERIRAWLADYRQRTADMPPDHFLSRAFGELLAQPDYGFHNDLDAGRVVAQVVDSARKFRQTVYPDGDGSWADVMFEYFDLVNQGLLAALYLPSWNEEERDAVFIAPAHTFLMRNRWVDYQFWLDLGSHHWFERLEQPLTHPYVLQRSYPPGQYWTDEMEQRARQDAQRRLLLGLVRRCRRHVYGVIAELGEQGYEQRGPLLRIVQELLQIAGEPGVGGR